MIKNDTIVAPNEATKEDLLIVHTERYLSSLKWSIQVARVLEVPPVAFLPNFLIQWRVLKPLRYQTGGTVLVKILRQKRIDFFLLISGRKISS
jgi:histone deacetylase 11